MKAVKHIFIIFTLFSGLFVSISPVVVHAQQQDPWAEVFNANGELQPGMVDLGVTTETPSWMNVQLPFNQSLNLEANYHRFQTPSGNMVVLPSASTLFFMALHPQESGLSNSVGMVSNGHGAMITFLGSVAGNSIDWGRLQQATAQGAAAMAGQAAVAAVHRNWLL